jgi:hypothetical protein
VEQPHELKTAFLALQQNKSGGIESNISVPVKTTPTPRNLQRRFCLWI